jgi:DNA polymerase III sliding clamp (beta) subunit (PCNA family)
VILPRKTVLELSKLLADATTAHARHPREPGALPFRERRARSKVVDGKFPDYNR